MGQFVHWHVFGEELSAVDTPGTSVSECTGSLAIFLPICEVKNVAVA